VPPAHVLKCGHVSAQLTPPSCVTAATRLVFRDPNGRQRKRSARTLAEAREVKASLTADVKRGEYRTLSKVTFADYAAEWIDSYQGRTSRGIRPETLADYRRDLGLDKDGTPIGDGAIGFFGRMTLASIEPRDVKRYAAELAARGLAPGSVRNSLAPCGRCSPTRTRTA
jgi:integrase